VRTGAGLIWLDLNKYDIISEEVMKWLEEIYAGCEVNCKLYLE
jgi:hypothetical protein